MFAIFTIESEAQKLCDKIHEYLTAECPGYNADKWQKPIKSETKLEWFVKLPKEFEKDYYPVKVELKTFIKPETDKAKEIDEKLPADFKEVEVVIINKD